MSARPRVLVADDHRAMLDSLVRLLSRDYDVVSAVTDGVSVVEAAALHEPDLLVLDIAMPGLSGIAAAARVKSSGAPVKIVFVTNLQTASLSRAPWRWAISVSSSRIASSRTCCPRFARSWRARPSSRRPVTTRN